MKKYISSEIYKLFKTNPFRICVLLDLVYILYKICSTIFMARYYSRPENYEQIISQYVSVGYDISQANYIVQRMTNPLGLDILCECCVGFIISGFMAGSFWSQEYKYGTFLQLISRGISKKKIFWGKLITSWLGTIAISILNIALYFGSVCIIFDVGKISGNLLEYCFRYFIVIVAISLMFVACAQLLAILCKSTAVALGGIALINIAGSSIVTAVSNIISDNIEIDYYWFISTPFYMLDYTMSIGKYNVGLLTILIYSLIFVILGYLIFENKDI